MKAHGETARTYEPDVIYSRNKLKVATYNARTLHQSSNWKVLSILHWLRVNRPRICCQTRTQIDDEEKVGFRWHPSGDFMLIYGSANAKRVGGVTQISQTQIRQCSEVGQPGVRQNIGS